MTHTEPANTAAANLCQPRFELGQIVSTPGALDACSRERHDPLPCAAPDRGLGLCMTPRTPKPTTSALSAGCRLLSAYPIDPAKPSGSAEKTRSG